MDTSGSLPLHVPTIVMSPPLGRFPVVIGGTAGTSAYSHDTESVSSGDGSGRFRRAVCRVLIALSFKSFRRRNETKRRRERSDCSEARFLAVTSASANDDPAGETQEPAEVNACGLKEPSTDEGFHIGPDVVPSGGTSETPMSATFSTSTMPRRGRRKAVYDPKLSKVLGRVRAPDGGDISPTNSYDDPENVDDRTASSGDEVNGTNESDAEEAERLALLHPITLISSLSSLVPDHQETASAPKHLRRKRSSADLGTNYPGDLLSLASSHRKNANAGCCASGLAATSSTTTSAAVTGGSSARRLAMSGPAGSRSGRRAPPPLLKRNTIGDFASTNAYHHGVAAALASASGAASSGTAGADDKKLKRTFSLLKLKKSHRLSKDNLPEMSEVLQNLKQSEFKDSYLARYKVSESINAEHKDAHWLDMLLGDKPDDDVRNRIVDVTETERKRREAVWELFKSECVFLIDHLMALKHCFMEPMKRIQVEGHLMFAEPQDVFGNLDELCYVSYTFSRDFITLLLKDSQASTDFGRTDILLKGLRRFCQLTRDGEVYHEYCLNYSKAMTYLEKLRKNDEFCEFEKWCEQDERCHRLQLNDLLISPMQHCTKVPLLLNNIRRYTEDPRERQLLTVSLLKLETSLQNLESKMKWLKNFERVQELQQQILWRPITEIEPRAFIPEFLRSLLSRQPCDRLLASPHRHLLHEGPITLLEISKTIDMYLFLFDDILLLTRIKKAPRKKSNTMTGDVGPYTKVHTDGALFVVHRQPIALDRLTIHDVRQELADDEMDCCSPDMPDASSPAQPPHQPLVTSLSVGSGQQYLAATTTTMTSSTGACLQTGSPPGSAQPSTQLQSGSPGLSPQAITIPGGTAAASSGASTSPSQQQQHYPTSPDSDGGVGPTDWCLPHLVDDCPGQRGSNLLFSCLSAANGAVLKNAFVIVQFNQFQQIIGVYTLQAQSDVCKSTWLSRLHEAQDRFHDVARSSTHAPTPSGSALHPSSALASPFSVEDGRSQVNITVERPGSRRGGTPIEARRQQPAACASGGGVARGPRLEHQQAISLLVPGLDDDEITDDPQEVATGRRMRSSSSDAAVISGSSESKSCSAELRRISDPIRHHTTSSAINDFGGSTTLMAAYEAGQAAGTGQAAAGTGQLAADYGSEDCVRRTEINEVHPGMNDSNRSDERSAQLNDEGTQISTMTSSSPDVSDVELINRRQGFQRYRQTSLRVKRRSLLKSIHEKSQSIDTC